MRSILKLTLLLAILIAGISVPMHAAFVLGDVFASVSNGQVNVYSSAGVLQQTLNTGLGGFTTGSALDAGGNFYVTDFSSSAVSKFDNAGVLQGTFGSGFTTPEDIHFDAAGNAFVGDLSGGIREFNSTGAPLTVFGTSRTDWFDLNAAETIAYFTDEGGTVHRWNMTTNTAMADLGSGGQFALRLLGDGTLLVADSNTVNRMDIVTGAITQTYSAPGASTLFALNLDPNGTSFWTGDVSTGNLFRLNIATGALEQTISTGAAGNLFGVSVFGEITQVAPPSGTPEPGTLMLLVGGLAAVVWRRRRAA
jgi:DNA-binding beta-propeller fold protein YncE